ncbi:MAG: hypothetical protein RO257_16410 [Candidatus Kapabacteria bacterium]|nr:hypothetical protein [Candidatus Kapabacteria bacterium]
MIVIKVNIEEYNSYVNDVLTAFETSFFNNLNKYKCDQLLYLLFIDDGSYKFGIIAGLKENVLRIPFSAPYSLFSSIKQNNKVMDFHKVVKSLIDFVTDIRSDLKINEIRITLPPIFYSETRISNLINALFVNKFKIDKTDLNFQYSLQDFNENYLINLNIKARQKLIAAFKNRLNFKKIVSHEELLVSYDIIHKNRLKKGFPLHLSFDDILNTSKIIDVDFFLVSDSNNNPIASSINFHVTKDINQVVYWGNLPDTDHLKPMNFLAYKIFEYYKNSNIKFIDIGPSTENSIPNFGLCDFKQSIGCNTSLKYSFIYHL